MNEIYGVFINAELVNEGTKEETDSFVTSEIEKIHNIYGDNNVEVLVPQKEEASQKLEDNTKVFLINVKLEKPLFFEILVIQQNG